MATTPTNYNSAFANKYVPIVEAWTERLMNMTPKWASFASLTGREGDYQARLYHDGLPTKLQDFTSTLSSFNIGADGSAGPVVTVTGAGKGLSAVVKFGDYERDPGLLDRVASALFAAAQRTVDDVVFTALAASTSATYTNPIEGGDETPAYIGSAHKTYATSGQVTQVNDVSAALSEAAVNSAVAKLNNWLAWADRGYMHLGYGPKALIVPPVLKPTALKLMKSMNLPYAESGNVGDVMNPRATEDWIVVDDALLTSATNWFIVDRLHSPIKVFLPIKPEFRIYDAANFQIQVEVAMELACGIAGPPAGLVGSSA